MLYSYGSFLSKITLSLLCIVVPVPYVSINPSKKREVQVVLNYNKCMIKKNMSIYFLIILVGIIILTSFVQFSFGSFDWPFFIIMMVYLVISSVLELFITSAVVSINSEVCSARIRRNEAYKKIEAEEKWDDYKKAYIESHTITNFHRAYCCYAFTSDSYAFERKGAALSKADFKKAYLAKQLKEVTKGEKIGFIRKRKMFYYEKDQDDTSFIDKMHLKYLRGEFLGKSGKDYVKGIISALLELASIGTAVFSMIHFSFDSALSYKLLILIAIFAGDVFLTISNIKADIKYEIDIADNAEDVAKMLINNEKSGIENTLAYHEFHSC